MLNNGELSLLSSVRTAVSQSRHSFVVKKTDKEDCGKYARILLVPECQVLSFSTSHILSLMVGNHGNNSGCFSVKIMSGWETDWSTPPPIDVAHVTLEQSEESGLALLACALEILAYIPYNSISPQRGGLLPGHALDFAFDLDPDPLENLTKCFLYPCISQGHAKDRAQKSKVMQKDFKFILPL